jgi:hypothetical protein
VVVAASAPDTVAPLFRVTVWVEPPVSVTPVAAPVVVTTLKAPVSLNDSAPVEPFSVAPCASPPVA